jgi:glutamate synthase domain-containing protein 3
MMVRSCHVDTCPVGIATQRPELREKFAGTPEMIISYVMSVAEDVRRHLAALGLSSFDDAVGRTDLLRRGERAGESARAELVDLTALLAAPRATPTRYDGVPVPTSGDVELGRSLLDATSEPLPITNRDRAIGAYLAGELARRDGPAVLRRFRFHGSAGQSFGAFLSEGIQLDLEGEANDYVGKSMSGGRIVVSPPPNDAGDPSLIGNTVLYGATGGELYCAGAAGERFAVRNSGATAVVEGVGSHGCEYMTGGLVVVLGPVGRNFAAGMTGGLAVVHDPDALLERRLNDELVELAPLADETAERVRKTLDAHARFTGSARAAELLESWQAALAAFRVVCPRADVAAAEAVPDLAEERSA